MIEVEIKALCPSFSKIMEILDGKKAKRTELLSQVDIYFNAPQRDLNETNEYIRIRFAKSADEGFFAHHINISDGVTEEKEVAVGNVAVFIDILKALDFRQLGTIDKDRIVYDFEGFKISLDDVKEIGRFIEIETGCNDESEVQAKKQECISLMESLGLSQENIINVWLADIATGKTQKPQ